MGRWTMQVMTITANLEAFMHRSILGRALDFNHLQADTEKNGQRLEKTYTY